MTKINEKHNKLNWLYSIGFFIILALPILTLPPYFFPPDFAKTLIFRSIMAIMLFGLFWANLNTSIRSEVFKNKIIWALGGIFSVFLLATIFSVDRNFSLWGSPYRGGGFVSFAFYFIFAILLFILLKKEDWKKAWFFSIFIGILVSLVAIIQYFGFLSKIFLPMAEPSSTLGNPILLAIYLMLLFFPVLSFAIKEENRNLKKFYIASLLIFIFAIFISGTRAVYLGMIAGILYFLFFYPHKFKKIKMFSAVFLSLIILTVLYANIFPQQPKFLQKIRIYQTLEKKLSIKSAFSDERYKAWQTVILEIKDKPVLGWGPENLAVGFDKNFNPAVTASPWWDKAHNIFLQTGAEAGILGILAYLILFIVLFWQLQIHKKEGNAIIICGLQAALIGYLISGFFSFDSFATYLILFLIIGYSLHLTRQETQPMQSDIKKNKIIIGILFLVLAIFLWQYNIVPFFINADINKADKLATQRNCTASLALMDKNLQKKSFLDSYLSMKYIGLEETCGKIYPEDNLVYVKEGIKILTQAVKIQPLYTRYWIYLGNLTATLAGNEDNPGTKNELISQASNYFNKALHLAPKHQEILLAQANLEIIAENYKNAQDYSKKCIALNPELGDCYFYLALSQIYLKDNSNANINLQLANSKKYTIDSEANLIQLLNAYGQNFDYQNLKIVLDKLVVINPDNAQYKSFLSIVNAKLNVK